MKRKGCRSDGRCSSCDGRCRPRHGRLRILEPGTAPFAHQVDPGREGLGVAIDLGTSTVVLRLHDLTTGEALATAAFENPQHLGGADIMARIRFDGEQPGLLQQVATCALADALDGIVEDPTRIRELVVVGNPTMRDLFFGLDVQPLGAAPYRSSSGGSSLEYPASKLGLALHPDATVYGLPLLGGHVGADTVASLIAHELTEGSMLLDLGTNTEIALAHRNKLWVASCPAGPAFEGGPGGMPAFDGAIQHIDLDEPIRLDVIGGVEAIGLCGSAHVDLLAELLRTGRMDRNARLIDASKGNLVFPSSAKISISEAHLAELALAKAAIAAGIRIASEAAGAEIESLLLAGGFGAELRIASARAIGLIPEVRTEQIGNAALEGATLALLSRRHRDRAETLAGNIEHVRLEEHPDFFDYFAEGCAMHPDARD